MFCLQASAFFILHLLGYDFLHLGEEDAAIALVHFQKAALAVVLRDAGERWREFLSRHGTAGLLGIDGGENGWAGGNAMQLPDWRMVNHDSVTLHAWAE